MINKGFIITIYLISAVSVNGTYYSGHQQMLELVNQARSAAGVKPVCGSDKLMASANVQSKLQASTNQISHGGSAGLIQRFVNQGFQPLSVAENVGKTPDTNVQSVFNAWISDAAHKANIVGASYTHFGSAVVQGSDGQYYWTQHLAQAANSNEPCISDGGSGNRDGTSTTPATGIGSPASPLPNTFSSVPTGLPGANPIGSPTNVPAGSPRPDQRGPQSEQNIPPNRQPPTRKGQPSSLDHSRPLPPGSNLKVNVQTPSQGPQMICIQGLCYQIVKTPNGIGYLPTSYKPPGQNINGGPVFV